MERKHKDGLMIASILLGVLLIIVVLLLVFVSKNGSFTTKTRETLSYSLYASKDIEVAIDSIDAEYISLRLLNKTDKEYTIQLYRLTVDGKDINTKFVVDMEPNCDKVESIYISEYDGTLKGAKNIDMVLEKVMLKGYVHSSLNQIELEININSGED